MRVTVDENCCIASGLCARGAPTVFGLSPEDGVVVVLTENPPTEHHYDVREAGRDCPGQAITVSER